MSMALTSLHSKTPVKFFSQKFSRRVHHFNPSFPFSFPLTAEVKPLNQLQSTDKFYGPFKKTFNGFSIKSRELIVKAQDETGLTEEQEKNYQEARAQSSLPQIFRHLMKEVPEKPVRWPWFLVLAFMLYAWRSVLWELKNWRNTLGHIGWFLGYISKFVMALIFHFMGDPITSLIHGVETTFYTIRSFYSGIVSYAPIPELTEIIILTSAILAVAEAADPDSANSQPYLLTVAGLIGFAAVRSYISELFFWTLLLGLFGFARLVKKRDYVSSALPVAAVLVAVGEPWVRVIVTALYLTLAMTHHYYKPVDSKEDEEDEGGIKRVPVPLLCAALVIGIRAAAKWAGYRHLTWMIV
ncbi:hypothetical protein CDL12_13137 [Handroanthus impetiginosus]|uniref:Uncharacterized protein n=1 Tax=Handroanthus impetiginosus TaxID=429701 RepID=A0A2G9HAB3_9LAMI|nr:hypothetical protein CDL12_13137 [Handroanthus impetiginosus]